MIAYTIREFFKELKNIFVDFGAALILVIAPLSYSFVYSIPYATEVVVESFKEDKNKIVISVVIYVERDSQKGIIIGKQGKALKKVATEARKELEQFFNKKIFLETFVKVEKDWRSSDKELKNFGYQQD